MEKLPKDAKCITQEDSRRIRLSVNTTVDREGVSVDTVSGWTEHNNTSQDTEMDITNTITECNGKRIIHIKGVTHAPRKEIAKDRLRFHPRCGKNIAVINKGLTAQLLNLDDVVNSPVFTHRPMKDEEIFEVKVELKNKTTHNFGIGIMTKSPSDVDILPEMYKSPFVWIIHGKSIWHNGSAVLTFTEKSTDKLQSEDRLGVMRSESGTLHFFLNGEDLGPAMSNVPPEVYGVVDVRGSFKKANIIYDS